jgi:hypothetical protein
LAPLGSLAGVLNLKFFKFVSSSWAFCLLTQAMGLTSCYFKKNKKTKKQKKTKKTKTSVGREKY